MCRRPISKPVCRYKHCILLRRAPQWWILWLVYITQSCAVMEEYTYLTWETSPWSDGSHQVFSWEEAPRSGHGLSYLQYTMVSGRPVHIRVSRYGGKGRRGKRKGMECKKGMWREKEIGEGKGECSEQWEKERKIVLRSFLSKYSNRFCEQERLNFMEYTHLGIS